MTARVLVVDDLRPNVKLLEAKLNGERYLTSTKIVVLDTIDLALPVQVDLPVACWQHLEAS